MISTKTSRVLPIIGGLTLLVTLVVVMKSCSEDEPAVATFNGVPIAPSPDADSPADTIKTLTANVSELINEVEALRRDNSTLRSEANEREEHIRDQVARQLSEFDQNNEVDFHLRSSDLEALQRQLDDLVAEFETSLQSLENVDFGSGIVVPQSTYGQPAYSWIRPVNGLSADPIGSLDSTSVQPALTVPRNATLIDSTVMTALVGRVPLDGHVRDPMPFKVLTGAENLAANGLKIDGVHGMVWSGFAFGDWTLSCVSGRLESVTFVFEDGTIRTIASAEASQGGGQSQLGWISDEYGVPCIAGERKSNAAQYLNQQVGMSAARAAAEASAAVETTNSLTLLGAGQSIVDGDIGKYILGKTLAGAANETASWLAERASQEYDAVFVPAGKKVAIHVDRQLEIDIEQEGRRLTHAEYDAF